LGNPSVAEVREFLVQQVSGPLSALGVAPEEVGDRFDLLAEGLLDSLGLVQLIAAIETRFQVEFDLEDLDVEDLGVVGPFSRYVATRARPMTEAHRR
jgi:acyl carrier protein